MLWLQRENLVLQQVEDELLYTLQRDKMLQLAPAMVWPDWDREGKLYFTTLDATDRIWELLWDRRVPWKPIETEGKHKEELKTWKEKWEARFGALDSPEVQEQERRLEERLKQEAIQAQRARTAKERLELQQKQTQQTITLGRLERRNTGDLRHG